MPESSGNHVRRVTAPSRRRHCGPQDHRRATPTQPSHCNGPDNDLPSAVPGLCCRQCLYLCISVTPALLAVSGYLTPSRPTHYGRSCMALRFEVYHNRCVCLPLLPLPSPDSGFSRRRCRSWQILAAGAPHGPTLPRESGSNSGCSSESFARTLALTETRPLLGPCVYCVRLLRMLVRSRVWLEAHHDPRGEQSGEAPMYVMTPARAHPHASWSIAGR